MPEQGIRGSLPRDCSDLASRRVQGISIARQRTMKMKHTLKVLLMLAVFALAGCSSHHESGHISANQAAKNGITAAFGGPRITSHTPSLAAYNLSGYHK